jgi:hypothetical protein
MWHRPRHTCGAANFLFCVTKLDHSRPKIKQIKTYLSEKKKKRKETGQKAAA